MDCEEAVYSNEYYDFIAEYILETRRTPTPPCVQRLDITYDIVYKSRADNPPLNIRNYSYNAIPGCYAPMDESALEASGILRLQNQPTLALKGQGVLIGFLDSGIDYENQVFRNSDGSTRIVAMWDQTDRSGTPPEGFIYGSEYTDEQINRALNSMNPHEVVPMTDEEAHGTYMASVAAGSEIPEKNFVGAAPYSKIAMVKLKPAKQYLRDFYFINDDAVVYQENDIMCGISYILRKARDLDKQAVICIGMGSNLGNHEGETPLCNMIDYLNMLPGVSIVTCAGNEGNAGHHYLITQEYEEISINVEKSSLGFVAELWWRTPGTLQFDVVAPGGNTLGITRAAAYIRERHRFVVENTMLEVIGGEIQQQTRDQVVMFRFENSKEGVWKIRVYTSEPNIRYHMWLPITQFLEGNTYFVKPDPDITICEPGNSRRSICMSAYNPADEAFFLQASRGFTPNGTIKPDVTAPGVNIYGPLPKNNYGTMTGTSVAAAITTGIAALFMQEYSDYGISGNSVRELLIRGAERRGEEFPSREWGYGTVDAYESITFE